MFGTSHASDAQFWGMENPLTPGYASRVGATALGSAPPESGIAGRLRAGARFVVRRAPAWGANAGGDWEVVVEANGIEIDYFATH
jgi:hypothetical protein